MLAMVSIAPWGRRTGLGLLRYVRVVHREGTQGTCGTYARYAPTWYVKGAQAVHKWLCLGQTYVTNDRDRTRQAQVHMQLAIR